MRIEVSYPRPLDSTASTALYDEAQYSVRDMHPVWKTLREREGIEQQSTPDGQTFYAATRQADVRTVLSEADIFSSAYSTMLTVRGDGDVAAGAAIHLTDRPLHASIKKVFSPLMTVSAIQQRAEGISGTMADLFASLRGREAFDFCEAMVTLPMTITGSLMGIPEVYWPVTGQATVAAMGGSDPEQSEQERRFKLFEAHTTIMKVLGDVLEEGASKDTIAGRCPSTSDLVGDQHPEAALLNAYAFLMGANPTVPQTINQTLILLAQDEDLWAWFARQEQTEQTFIDEALRWASPVNHVLRRTTADFDLAGTPIPAGSLVTAWLASANRDEEVYTEPYRFIPDRSPNPHLAFGLGVHRCIGQNIAVLGLKTFFDHWRANVASMALVDDPKHLVSNFLNGVVRLPLAVTWKDPDDSNLLPTDSGRTIRV